jgi:hypothetical protein
MFTDNLFDTINNYTSKNQDTFLDIIKGIIISNNDISVGDALYTIDNKVYMKNLYINGNQSTTDVEIIKNIYLYGGLGIKKDMYLNGQLNIMSNIDTSKQVAFKIFKEIKVNGNSLIEGNIHVANILSLSILKNNGKIELKDIYISDDYYSNKRINGNIYNVNKNIIINNVSSNIISNIITEIYTNTLVSNNIINGNINTEIGNIKRIKTDIIEINDGSEIGNLNLNGLIIDYMGQYGYSNIYVENIIGNINININSNLIIGNIIGNNIIGNKINGLGYNIESNITEEFYANNINIVNIIFENDISSETISSDKIIINNKGELRKIIGDFAKLTGNIILEGGFSYINEFIIGDNLPIFNRSANELSKNNADCGFVHIYENEIYVPCILYKKIIQTNYNPIGTANDVVVFGLINIKNLSSNVPMKEIYFDIAQVYDLIPVHANSFAGNNLVITSNNTEFGNVIINSNIISSNLITNNINIEGNLSIDNLNAKIIKANIINANIIKPISGNIILSNIYIKKVDIDEIYTKIANSNIVNVNVATISSNTNFYVTDVIISGNVQTKNLYSNILDVKYTSNVGNIYIIENINANNIYTNNFIYTTQYTSTNSNENKEITLLNNLYRSITIELSEGNIGEKKYYILEYENGYQCYINTNKKTFYLNNQYNYCEIYYDGYEWNNISGIGYIANNPIIKTGIIDAEINYQGDIIIGKMIDRLRIYTYTNSWHETDIFNIVDKIKFSKSDNKYIVSNISGIGIYDDNNLILNIPYIKNIKDIAYSNGITIIGTNYYYNDGVDIYNGNIYIDTVIGPNVIEQGKTIDISIDGNIIIIGGKNEGLIYERDNKNEIYEIEIGNIHCSYYEEGNLYIGGNNILKRIEIFNNKQYDFGIINGNVNDIVKYKGNITVCGKFNTISGEIINNMGYWHNGWNSIINNSNKEIIKMKVDASNIYICNIDGVSKYENTWNHVINVENINTIEVYKGNIYIGTENKLFRYDNILNDMGINGKIDVIKEYMGNIYIGGEFNSYGNYSGNFGIWNGEWKKSGINMNNNIKTIYPYDGNLLIGGDFNSIHNDIELFITNNLKMSSDVEFKGNSIIRYNINEKTIEGVSFENKIKTNQIIYDKNLKIYMIVGEKYRYIKESVYSYRKKIKGNTEIIKINEGIVMGNIIYDKYGEEYIERYNIEKIKTGSYNNRIIYNGKGNIIGIGIDNYGEYDMNSININEEGNIEKINSNYNGTRLVVKINGKIYIY